MFRPPRLEDGQTLQEIVDFCLRSRLDLSDRYVIVLLAYNCKDTRFSAFYRGFSFAVGSLQGQLSEVLTNMEALELHKPIAMQLFFLFLREDACQPLFPSD